MPALSSILPSFLRSKPPAPEPTPPKTDLEKLAAIITPLLSKSTYHATISEEQITAAQRLWENIAQQKQRDHPDCSAPLHTLLMIRSLRDTLDTKPQRINLEISSAQQEFDARFCFVCREGQYFPAISKARNHNWPAEPGKAYALPLSNTPINQADLPELLHCDQDTEGEELNHSQTHNSMHFLYGSNPSAHSQRNDQKEHTDQLKKLLEQVDQWAPLGNQTIPFNIPTTQWLKTLTHKSEQKKLVAAIVFRMPFDLTSEKDTTYRQLFSRVARELGFEGLSITDECPTGGVHFQQTSDAEIAQHTVKQALGTLQEGIPDIGNKKTDFYAALKTLFSTALPNITNPALRCALMTRLARQQLAKPIHHIKEGRANFDNALSFRAEGDNQCALYWDDKPIEVTFPLAPEKLSPIFLPNTENNGVSLDQWSDLAPDIQAAYKKLQAIGNPYANSSNNYAFTEVTNILQDIKGQLKQVTNPQVRQRIIAATAQSLLNPCDNEETYIQDIARIAHAINIPAYTKAAQALTQSLAPDQIIPFDNTMTALQQKHTFQESIDTLKTALTSPAPDQNATADVMLQWHQPIQQAWETLMTAEFFNMPKEAVHRVPFILLHLRLAAGTESFQKLSFDPKADEKQWLPSFQGKVLPTEHPITSNQVLLPFMCEHNGTSAIPDYRADNLTNWQADDTEAFQTLLTELRQAFKPPNTGNIGDITGHKTKKYQRARDVIIKHSSLWDALPETHRAAAIMHMACCFLEDTKPAPGADTVKTYTQAICKIAEMISNSDYYAAAASLVKPFEAKTANILQEHSKASAQVPAEVLQGNIQEPNEDLNKLYNKCQIDTSDEGIYTILRDYRDDLPPDADEEQYNCFLRKLLLLKYPEGGSCNELSQQIIAWAFSLKQPTLYKASASLLETIEASHALVNTLRNKIKGLQ